MPLSFLKEFTGKLTEVMFGLGGQVSEVQDKMNFVSSASKYSNSKACLGNVCCFQLELSERILSFFTCPVVLYLEARISN